MLGLIFGLLTLLLVIGVPIAIALGATAVAVMLIMGGPDLLIVFAQRSYSPALSFPLLAVPFFILSGNIMNASGMTKIIFDAALLFVGRMKGGLGYVNVLASLMFAGMSGSAVADAAGMGTVEIKAMQKAGYGRAFSATITAVSSTIGPILPPSIPFVIYGSLAGVSVGSLFLAGIVPALVMATALLAVISVVARKREFPVSEARPPLKESAGIILKAGPALTMPVFIIGGILSGLVTPTEAAVFASAYTIFVGRFVYRNLSFGRLVDVCWDSVKQTAQVLFIVATAGAFGWILVQQQVPTMVITAMLGVTDQVWLILLIINLVLLFLGMFIEGLAIIIMAYPILLPLVLKIGVDPTHFGVIMVLNVMIGLITPPVGLVLYVVMGISGATMQEIIKEILPYFFALVVVLGIVTYVPAVSLAVPHLFGFR